MKATAQPLATGVERRAPALRDGSLPIQSRAELELCAPAQKTLLGVYADLFKARLTLLVLLTTMVGFYIGFRGPVNYWLMFSTLLGTALVAGGASALNQLLERDYDAKMLRTQDRPLPSGRLQPLTVLIVGCLWAAIGLVYLAFAVTLTTSIVGGVSLLSKIHQSAGCRKTTHNKDRERLQTTGR